MSGLPGRRAVLQLLAGGGAATLAGCLGDDDDGPGDGTDADNDDGNGVDVVDITSNSHEVADAVHSLTFRYTTDTVSRLPGNYDSISVAEGAKLVILETRVTVTSVRNDGVHVHEGMVGLQTNEARYEPEQIPGMPFLKNTVIPPANFGALAIFEVPEEVTEAVLVPVDPGLWFPVPAEIIFQADDSINVSL